MYEHDVQGQYLKQNSVHIRAVQSMQIVSKKYKSKNNYKKLYKHTKVKIIIK